LRTGNLVMYISQDTPYCYPRHQGFTQEPNSISSIAQSVECLSIGLSVRQT
jgi:hypothetical protein